jgi:hypothetical protein
MCTIRKGKQMEQEKMYPAPGTCPVCGNHLVVTQLSCDQCHTRLEGRFMPGPLGRLNADQCRFVEVFLATRGNLREAGKILGISYPTIRARLDEVLAVMGMTAEEPAPQSVLEQLQRGEITMDEALAHFGHGNE